MLGQRKGRLNKEKKCSHRPLSVYYPQIEGLDYWPSGSPDVHNNGAIFVHHIPAHDGVIEEELLLTKKKGAPQIKMQ